MRMFMQSVVFGKQADGSPANPPSEKDEIRDYTFTPPGSTRVIGGWWALQHDVSDSNAMAQFTIGGPSGNDNDIPELGNNHITFRVRKTNGNAGLIRVAFFVLYV